MKKRILSLFLAFIMFFGMIPSYSIYATESPKEISIRSFNPASEVMEEIDKAELYRGGELYLSADIREDIYGDIQWQIEADQDLWVDIQGCTTEELRVSYGMVQSLLKDNSVRVRCVVLGDTEYSSAPVTVALTDVDNRLAADTFDIETTPVASEPLPAPVAVINETETMATEATAVEEITEAAAEAVVSTADNSAQDEDVIYHTITIEYVYGAGSKYDGQRVALSYIAEVISGETMTGTVTSPTCIGYKPDIASVNLAELGKITGNISRTVKYDPAMVSYTVRHYQQNVDDDEYVWVDTTMATGETEDLTSDAAAKTYTGFTALSHYHEEIAADSSTMIDIYYDRNYYLISFDLDGGYGVDSIYARYGADISVGTPYKAGWDFAGWDGTIPSTMPSEDRSFKASWTAQTGIGFTVAYWLEDANTDGKYNFWGSVKQAGNAGATVQGETYKDYTKYLDATTVSNMDPYEKIYSYYDHADTDVVIKGDGSTVVNVYYNRNEYTLKFYYAARTGTAGSYTYKVYGGSTYFFGQDNSNSYNGDELELLNAIYTNDSYDHQWGEVTAEPALNTLGNSRSYTTGVDRKNNVDFLYLSFTAKYGEDISALWPCNVFEPATRSYTDNDSGWTGVKAFVSAWNGEHHVYYSQHNTNETIKGNYNELDYQLLFDNCGTHNYTDSSTVAYLCFWENGSGDVNWNIPELYRYNIYVPVLTGNEPNQITNNGVQYYLWATYDTCDNSTVDEQTPPAINGYDYINIRTSTPLHKYSGSDPTKNIIATKEDSPILFDENGNQIYKEVYDVNFFYSRRQYQLEFANGGETVITEQVPFNADISQKAPDVSYHDDELKDIYVFNG